MNDWQMWREPGSPIPAAVIVHKGRRAGTLDLDAEGYRDLSGRLSMNLDDPETCPVDHTCDEDEVCGCWCEVHDCRIAECPTFKLVDSWLSDAGRKVHAADGKVAALREELDRERRVSNETAAETARLRAFVDQIRWLRDQWWKTPGRSEPADALDAALDEMAGTDAPRGSVQPAADARPKVSIDFWTCPVWEHGDRWDASGWPVETVRWEGDVAHCTAPDCGRTSADPRPDTHTTEGEEQ
jgi:hypothetical protein